MFRKLLLCGLLAIVGLGALAAGADRFLLRVRLEELPELSQHLLKTLWRLGHRTASPSMAQEADATSWSQATRTRVSSIVNIERVSGDWAPTRESDCISYLVARSRRKHRHRTGTSARIVGPLQTRTGDIARPDH